MLFNLILNTCYDRRTCSQYRIDPSFKIRPAMCSESCSLIQKFIWKHYLLKSVTITVICVLLTFLTCQSNLKQIWNYLHLSVTRQQRQQDRQLPCHLNCSLGFGIDQGCDVQIARGQRTKDTQLQLKRKEDKLWFRFWAWKKIIIIFG